MEYIDKQLLKFIKKKLNLDIKIIRTDCAKIIKNKIVLNKLEQFIQYNSIEYSKEHYHIIWIYYNSYHYRKTTDELITERNIIRNFDNIINTDLDNLININYIENKLIIPIIFDILLQFENFLYNLYSYYDIKFIFIDILLDCYYYLMDTIYIDILFIFYFNNYLSYNLKYLHNTDLIFNNKLKLIIQDNSPEPVSILSSIDIIAPALKKRSFFNIIYHWSIRSCWISAIIRFILYKK